MPILYINNKGKFEPIGQKVLSLRPTIDVLIVHDVVYLLTMAGENLFNMARSYKNVCKNRVETVIASQIVFGADEFKAVAFSGHNPRKFVSFSEKKLAVLKKKSTLKSISKQFGIPLTDSGDRFDATQDGAADKIIKILCGKGMLDPIEKEPVEVDGARKWK